MRDLLLAAAVVTGMLTLPALDASAAPATGLVGVQVAPSHALVTKVVYYHNHRRWHHRRWDHGRWRYWN